MGTTALIAVSGSAALVCDVAGKTVPTTSNVVTASLLIMRYGKNTSTVGEKPFPPRAAFQSVSSVEAESL
jgi:hypothetical protein